MAEVTEQLSPQMQMQEIIDLYPGAQRALFQKYHIGGCSSCGFSDTDTLEEVMINHNRAGQVGEAMETILESARRDRELEISVQEVASDQAGERRYRLIDIREPWERDIAHIAGDEFMTRELAYEIMQNSPRDAALVFYCHTGRRTLEAAAYFRGHGFTNAMSMAGGIEAWSLQIDPDVQRYSK